MQAEVFASSRSAHTTLSFVALSGLRKNLLHRLSVEKQTFHCNSYELPCYSQLPSLLLEKWVLDWKDKILRIPEKVSTKISLLFSNMSDLKCLLIFFFSVVVLPHILEKAMGNNKTSLPLLIIIYIWKRRKPNRYACRPEGNLWTVLPFGSCSKCSGIPHSKNLDLLFVDTNAYLKYLHILSGRRCHDRTNEFSTLIIEQNRTRRECW